MPFLTIALSTLLAAGCEFGSDVVAPAPTRHVRSAIPLLVDVTNGRVTVAPPTAPTATLGSHGTVPSFALLGQNEIGVATSNFFRSAVGAFTPFRLRVRFDLALTNKLLNADLVASTFPAPPPGVAQVVAFPFATNPAGLFGLKVRASADWSGTGASGSGAPHNFFNDDICIALTPPSDCFRWEAFGSTIEAGATTPARTVGFDVDPSVSSFTVYIVLAADVRDRSALPAIAVSQGNALFSALAHGTSPDAQVIHVTNAGGGTLAGLATNVTYESGQPQGWLTTSLSATTAPAELTLQAGTIALDPGIYRATVTLASPHAGSSPVSIAVGLVVALPLITLSPTHVDAVVGVGASQTQVIQVTSASGVPISDLAVEIGCGTADCGWLSATLSGTTTPTTLTVTETSAGLPPGRSLGFVHVSSPLGAAQPLVVQVDLVVLPDLTFIGTPTTVTATGSVTVTDLVVINQGPSNGPPNATGPFNAGVCLSTTALLADCIAEAVSLRPSLVASGVDHLPPMQVVTAPGTYHVIAYVDPPLTAMVNESDETNNILDLGEVVVAGSPEVCDGRDNDLDGEIDEGFTLPCSIQPPTVSFLFPDALSIPAASSGTLTVSIGPVQPTWTVVTLAVDPPASVIVPESVTIPGGQTTVSFSVTGVLPGTAVVTTSLNTSTASSTVTVTPSGTGYPTCLTPQEVQLANIINAMRVEAGVPPVPVDTRLVRAARASAAALAHLDASAYGYGGGALSQIGAGFATAADYWAFLVADTVTNATRRQLFQVYRSVNLRHLGAGSVVVAGANRWADFGGLLNEPPQTDGSCDP